ncbi:MAG: hypothetical protein QOC59_1347, partial [Microbacteriaceae bacterium]|nr:hypothetical protein [Microbacteriaceae bacterium]
MTSRTRIADLAALEDGPVSVGGWIETVRDQKKVQFLVLRDETGAVQLVRQRPAEDDDVATAISAMSLGSFVRVDGRLKHDERVKLGGIEVQIESLDVVGASEPEQPIAADSSVDKRMDWRFLDLRHPAQQLIFRVQTTFEHALRTWWVERDYIEVHTPKLMASPSESRAELFQLAYFDTVAYLAQSPQHFKQMAQAAGFGGVFEIADAFRADPSFTARHATEFTSVDMEVSWVDSHEDVMAIQEELLVAGLTAVREKHGEDLERLFGVTVTVPERPFPRIPLAEAKEIVAREGYVVPRADEDMDPEGERRIAAHVKERFGHDFVFLTDYASNI